MKRALIVAALAASPATASTIDWFPGYGFRAPEECRTELRLRKWEQGHYWSVRRSYVCTDIPYAGKYDAPEEAPYSATETAMLIVAPTALAVAGSTSRVGPVRATGGSGLGLGFASVSQRQAQWQAQWQATTPDTPSPVPGPWSGLLLATALGMIAWRKAR